MDALGGSRADERKRHSGLYIVESERVMVIIRGAASERGRPENLFPGISGSSRSKSDCKVKVEIIVARLRRAVLSYGHADVGVQRFQGK